jgi:hypothetical protein
MKNKLLLLLPALLIICKGFTQNTQINGWIKLLKDDSKNQTFSSMAVQDSIGKFDTLKIISHINDLEKETANAGKRLRARVKAVKSKLFFYKLGPGDSLYASLMKNALADAYSIGDDYMVAEYSRWYGEMLNSLNNKSLAAQYCLNSLKIQKELGLENFPTVMELYLTVGEMMYWTRNNEAAIQYYQEGFHLPDNQKTDRMQYAHSLNALGKCYMYVEKPDSSVFYHQQCVNFVRKHKLPDDLAFLATVNQFEPFFKLKLYDSCKNILAFFIKTVHPTDNPEFLMYENYMKGMLAMGANRLNEAVAWFKKSEAFGKNLDPESLTDTYQELLYCYEKLNMPQKAVAYKLRFHEAAQRLYQIKKKGDASLLEAESEFQKSKVMLTKLSAERKADIRKRNFFIAGIILLALTGIFYLNRKRKKSETARQLAVQKSNTIETKYLSVEEQLNAFRNDVAEKNNQIETLKGELDKKETSKADIGKIDDLSRQIILTENDWTVFKNKFDSVYPAFFTTLKNRFPDITNAELRMAAFIRLNFDNKHIASMLGISVDSVHKTRYRLRKRFGDDSGPSLEEFIFSI